MAALLMLLLALILALAWRGVAGLEPPPQRLWAPVVVEAELEPAGDEAPAIVRRALRPAIVLAHGMAGFDSLGVGALRVAYFRRATAALERAGYDVITTKVPAVGALPWRAEVLAAALAELPHERVTIVAHSMGGLDARWAIHHGAASRVAALVTIGTPHRGTPLADIFSRGPGKRAREWAARLGIPSDAVDWLTTWKLAELAPDMKDHPEVRYASVVGVASLGQLHPLLLAPHLYLRGVAGPNDGMVPESSQRWGEVVAREHIDHFAQIGWSGGDPAALIDRCLRHLHALPSPPPEQGALDEAHTRDVALGA